jgi:hypothetical protein
MSSLIPSDPSALRHLGANGPRPPRSPAILGLIGLLVLIALPLYLLRRPKPVRNEVAEVALHSDSRDAGVSSEASALTAISDTTSKRVTLADPKTARCTPKGGGRVNSERCDRLTAFEEALTRSIRDNTPCAPPAAAPYTVSFVLSLDFERKSMHLWAGKSGTLKKRNAADLIHCVERAITLPDWGTVTHQYQRYDVNVIASYPGGGMAGTTMPLGGP